MDRLQTQDDGKGGGGGLHMEQLDTLKTLKDESRIVGRAVGFWTWSGMVCSVWANRARSRYSAKR